VSRIIVAVLNDEERVSGGDRYGIVDESVEACQKRMSAVVPYLKMPTSEELARGEVWMLKPIKPEEDSEGGWTHCGEYMMLP